MILDILVMVGVGLLITQIANVATTVYLHRALAHRALTLRGPLPALFKAVVWSTTGIKQRQWVAVHRKHHAFTDEAEDPHSPARLGWKRVQFTNVALYRAAARDQRNIDRYSRDLPATRMDRMLFDRAALGLGIGVVFLVLLLTVLMGFPLWVPLGAALIHVVTYIGLGGAVNAIAHTFGRRPHDNSATNLQWLAYITAGEGLHNNHHAAPTSARFAFTKRETDPGWWWIKLFRAAGLAEVRHDDIKLAKTPARAA